MSAVKRALRQFAFGTGKTAGRNSSGRITSFHRGGGAKRLQRTVDLKRNSAPSSMGVVERIEYDPNRSSSIALIRWVHGVNHQPLSRRAVPEKHPAPPPRKLLEFDPASSSAAVDGGASSIRGVFALNSMLPQQHAGTASRDVFLTAFSPKRGSGSKRDFGSESHSLGLPRIAAAAARAAYFAPRARGEEDALQVRNWKRNSDVWVNRNKRKAAIPWHSMAR